MSNTALVPVLPDHAAAPPMAAMALLPEALALLPHGVALFNAEGRLLWSNNRWRAIWLWPEALTQPGTPAAALRDAQLALLMPGQLPPAPVSGVGAPQLWPLADGRQVSVRHQPLSGGAWLSLHDDLVRCELTDVCNRQAQDADAITGLPSRSQWLQVLRERLAERPDDEEMAVICINLQHFRRINQTWGQDRGDALLHGVAQRLAGCLRSRDWVTRLGADDFAVLQIGGHQPQGATAMARRIAQAMNTPLEIDGQSHALSVGIGIAVAPFDSNNADELIRYAQAAQRSARQQGPNRWCFFEPDMDAADRLRHSVEHDLRLALERGEFELDYQPQYDLTSGRLSGVEALLRWRHPTRGRVSPLDFIPVAEDSGLIVPIGRWVLQQACRDAASWPDDLRVAVNVSSVQFASPGLLTDVRLALAAQGLPARRLELEITEAVLLRDTNRTVAMLQDLQLMGVHLAMDDFGTGYSSLSYLRRFPFDRLKIDRSFVRDLHTSADALAIVRAVSAMGKSLGMSVTVEGVETQDQLALARAEGCAEAQGFLMSRPRPAAEIAALLADGFPMQPQLADGAGVKR